MFMDRSGNYIYRFLYDLTTQQFTHTICWWFSLRWFSK